MNEIVATAECLADDLLFTRALATDRAAVVPLEFLGVAREMGTE